MKEDFLLCYKHGRQSFSFSSHVLLFALNGIACTLGLSLESGIESSALRSQLRSGLLWRGHPDFDATGLGDEVVHAGLVQLDLVNDGLGRVGVLFFRFLLALSVILKDLCLHAGRQLLAPDL